MDAWSSGTSGLAQEAMVLSKKGKDFCCGDSLPFLHGVWSPWITGAKILFLDGGVVADCLSLRSCRQWS